MEVTEEMISEWVRARTVDYIVIAHLNLILAGVGLQGVIHVVGWHRLAAALGLVVGVGMVMVPGVVALVAGIAWLLWSVVCLLRGLTVRRASEEPDLTGVSEGRPG